MSGEMNIAAYILLLIGLNVAVNCLESSTPTFTCTATCPLNATATNGTENFSKKGCNELLNATRANTKSINQLKDILSDLKNKSYTTEAVLNNVLLFVEELVVKKNPLVTSTSPLPKSCKEIKARMRTSPSGVYLIAADEKKTQHVYCHMDTLCDSDKGWTRLAHIDMTDAKESCPGGLRLYKSNEVRACGRPCSRRGSCQSVHYRSYDVKYSQVCGRVRGYSYASPDAVDSTIGSGHSDVNSHYVDGVSITRGNPRKHIWTFMAGLKEDNSFKKGRFTCPCQKGSKQSRNIPYFIGNDYFCESGNPSEPRGFSRILYTADPLWDGKKCRGLESPCCVPSLPWFTKQIGTITNEDIEVRVCGDQSTKDEDVAIEQLELYVQ